MMIFGRPFVLMGLYCLHSSLVQSFVLMGQRSGNQIVGNHDNNMLLFAVTEEEVIAKVEKAEALWEQAHEARALAKKLSEEAYDEADSASTKAFAAKAMLRESVSLEKISQADAATLANIEAASKVDKALDASDKADRLEELAEKALDDSERSLEQHLIDFPESELA